MALGKSSGGGADRYSRLGSGKPQADQASWEDATPDALWRAVIAVTNAGDGITLSKTKDGGALAVTLLHGGQRIPHYPRGEEAIEQLLLTIRAAAEEDN